MPYGGRAGNIPYFTMLKTLEMRGQEKGMWISGSHSVTGPDDSSHHYGAFPPAIPPTQIKNIDSSKC